MKRHITIFITALVLAGCTSSPRHRDSRLSEETVIELASEFVRTNETWVKQAVFQATQTEDGTWLVTAWRVTGYDSDGKPLFTPGGFRDITIDGNGEVTAYIRGR